MITQILIVFCSLALGWLLRETITTPKDKALFAALELENEIKDHIIDEMKKSISREDFEKAANAAVDQMSAELGVKMWLEKDEETKK